MTGYVRDGEIGLSVRNELDVAQARSRRWLVATQLPSGAWDSTNSCGATALAALALSDVAAEEGDEAEAFAAASRRAVSWLRGLSEEQLAGALPEERAWRDCAIAATDSPDSLQKRFSEALMAFAGGKTDDGADGANGPGIARECALEISAGSAESRAALAARLGASWRENGMPRDGGCGARRSDFLVACFIGGCADGILSAEAGGRATRVPWREDVAGELISRQRRDPRRPAAAFWRGGAAERERDWAAEAVPETAFALLCIGLL